MGSSYSSGPDYKVRQHLENLVKSSERTSRISFLVSIVALLLAFASVFFAYKADNDDKEWKESQISLLKEISEKGSEPFSVDKVY